MIRQVAIRNYKCLREVTVALEPFTVLVGANGSGKTSVLEAIHNTVRAVTGEPHKVFAHERHGDWIYTRGGMGDLSVELQTEHGLVAIHATPPEGFPPESERLQKGLWNWRGRTQGPALDEARRLVYLKLNSAELGKPSYSNAQTPRVEFDGSGLASVLAYMKLNDPDGFDNLVSVAQGLIPKLRRIRFRKAPVRRTVSELVRFGSEVVNRSFQQTVQGELMLFDYDNAEDISARTASEGTLFVIGLLAVLLGPAKPRIVLLDDIEHGFHPVALHKLVETIRNLQDKMAGLQVVATSHSTRLLDSLEPDQVRMVARGADGWTRIGRLSDHPKFAKWKDEFSPGEMWSVFGDEWVAEAEAAKT